VNPFTDTPYTPLLDKYPSCPAGFEDHWCAQYFEINLAGNGNVARFPLQLDTDAVFYWRAVMGNKLFQFTILLYDPWGNELASGVDLAENILDNAQPGVFFPEIVCPAGSTPLIDVAEYTGSSGLLKLALVGVKRYVAHG
jgi:hypothetical protein